MIKGLTICAILLTATSVEAAGKVNATINHVYKNVWDTRPTTSLQCYNKEVPVYGTVQRQGDAVGGALLGMIIGGVAGKAISGKDKGAAGGAVIGGLIGADRGSKPKSKTVITGYRNERVCEDVTTYEDVKVKAYSHSVIKWRENGRIYSLEFQR